VGTNGRFFAFCTVRLERICFAGGADFEFHSIFFRGRDLEVNIIFKDV